ncbi:hypothetical protein SEA_MADAMATO_34 [Streptomyces phage Madamato]|nr:hypothetical protein SEA_MADAMATO_34 [Streptomyces phage Madamato]
METVMVKFLAASVILGATASAAFILGVIVGGEVVRQQNEKTETDTKTES